MAARFGQCPLEAQVLRFSHSPHLVLLSDDLMLANALLKSLPLVLKPCACAAVRAPATDYA